MTYELNTLAGETLRVGFAGSYVSELMLGGELPMIPTELFSEYASLTIVAAIPQLDEEDRRNVHRLVEAVSERIRDLPLRAEEPAESPAIASKPSARQRLGARALMYANNPFVYTGDIARVADTYEVTGEDFLGFVAHYLAGGHMGWGELGVPQYVQDALANISTALQLYE